MKNNLIHYLFITLSIIVNSCNEGFKDEPIKYSNCPATIDTTLLAHYAFEGNLKDSSSYNRDLTEVGSNITYSAADNQSNKSGRAALFNGSNTYAYTTDITLSDNFTVAFWTKPDSPNMARWDSAFSTGAVSYTHLTLPTILLV